MTHFLRRNGNTIVDVEATADDLHCVVCIDEYSALLLDEVGRQQEVIADFQELQELRGEWFELINCKESSSKFAERRLRSIARKYDLQYVVD